VAALETMLLEALTDNTSLTRRAALGGGRRAMFHVTDPDGNGSVYLQDPRTGDELGHLSAGQDAAVSSSCTSEIGRLTARWKVEQKDAGQH
jgi:hypothetical protein